MMKMKIKINEIEKIPSYNQKSSNDSKSPLEILMEKKTTTSLMKRIKGSITLR